MLVHKYCVFIEVQMNNACGAGTGVVTRWSAWLQVTASGVGKHIARISHVGLIHQCALLYRTCLNLGHFGVQPAIGCQN
jgi:hypothetical protein